MPTSYPAPRTAPFLASASRDCGKKYHTRRNRHFLPDFSNFRKIFAVSQQHCAISRSAAPKAPDRGRAYGARAAVSGATS
jgi:hypothetical protein